MYMFGGRMAGLRVEVEWTAEHKNEVVIRRLRATGIFRYALQCILRVVELGVLSVSFLRGRNISGQPYLFYHSRP